MLAFASGLFALFDVSMVSPPTRILPSSIWVCWPLDHHRELIRPRNVSMSMQCHEQPQPHSDRELKLLTVNLRISILKNKIRIYWKINVESKLWIYKLGWWGYPSKTGTSSTVIISPQVGYTHPT